MLEAHAVIADKNRETNLTLELTFDDRQKSRHKAVTPCGQTVGWFIERGHVLKQGEYLQCTSGECIKIIAAPESVSTVYAHNSLDLMRAAYHLGNRHVPLQITSDFLRYQHDHVLDAMVKGLGLNVECEKAPFQPEPGAYANDKAVGHSHHSHSHSHHHEH